VLLGPTSPDPTINTSMLSINSGNGTPLANGALESVAVRKPTNPNRLYISGLPYNWRTQHVRMTHPAWCISPGLRGLVHVSFLAELDGVCMCGEMHRQAFDRPRAECRG
jgi:hypothetical protein